MSVPNQRKQNNDRNWYAQHPKQNSATHFVLPFLCDFLTCGGRFGSEAFRLNRENPPRPEPGGFTKGQRTLLFRGGRSPLRRSATDIQPLLSALRAY
jgi:hypothetical protein